MLPASNLSWHELCGRKAEERLNSAIHHRCWKSLRGSDCDCGPSHPHQRFFGLGAWDEQPPRTRRGSNSYRGRKVGFLRAGDRGLPSMGWAATTSTGTNTTSREGAAAVLRRARIVRCYCSCLRRRFDCGLLRPSRSFSRRRRACGPYRCVCCLGIVCWLRADGSRNKACRKAPGGGRENPIGSSPWATSAPLEPKLPSERNRSHGLRRFESRENSLRSRGPRRQTGSRGLEFPRHGLLHVGSPNPRILRSPSALIPSSSLRKTSSAW
jgi:hypothetical protein